MSSKTRALLAIDMQNDFFDERGAFSKRHRDARELAEAVQMLRLFRDENVAPGSDASAYRPGFEVRDLHLLNGAP